MAALTVTAAQVLPSTPLATQDGIAGEAITQGQSVYFDTSTGKWKMAQCDGTAAEAGQDGYGIALTAAGAAGQPIVVALPGSVITLGAGAAPAAGTLYYVGATFGSLVPSADLASTNKVLPIALGLTTNRLRILAGAYDAGAIKP
jgi:hypothetical protein